MALTSDTKRILLLRRKIEDKFDANSWSEIGIITGYDGLIDNHPRLLRSLSWGDTDYSACILEILKFINASDPSKLDMIESYLKNGFDDVIEDETGQTIAGDRLYIQPTVFKMPETSPNPDLLSAMMPFDRSFDSVYAAIKESAKANFMTVERADQIWDHSEIIQDIFSLIYRSHIVVCDFSNANTNVFYETGIAHTLGKHVIPMARHMSELPFDLKHHRAIIYQHNEEGISKLKEQLTQRIRFLLGDRNIKF